MRNHGFLHGGLEHYLDVARFVRGLGFSPLFLLGPSEREFKTAIREAGFNAGVCLPFRKIAGLFDPDYGTTCVVGNDTGLMHLACELGAPSVTIMPFDSQFTWFPYRADPRAPHVCLAPRCSAPMCLNECREVTRCVGKISVEMVEHEVRRLLGISPAP